MTVGLTKRAKPGLPAFFSVWVRKRRPARRRGPEFSKLLARLLVKGVADPLSLANTESTPQEHARDDGVLLTSIPNPVHAREEPGVTNITWSTGHGSEGQVYASGVGVYAGRHPIDGDEAKRYLELAKGKGVQYLLVPAKSFWWLDTYKEFRKRVEARYPVVMRDENTCIVFDLCES